MTRKLNVLIACEESQAECLAFRSLGHNAYSCDIQPCLPKGHPEWHIHADCTPYLQGQSTFITQDGKKHRVSKWHLIIAHPPCTYLCRLSSVQLYRPPIEDCLIWGQHLLCNKQRLNGLKAGRKFFVMCLHAKAPYLAVENPIPMALSKLPRPSCYACPSWFGVKYTKKTCYWLKNLPPLLPKIIYSNPKSFVDSSRGKYRSRTFPQLAQAIAEQWSSYILNDMKKKAKLQ